MTSQTCLTVLLLVASVAIPAAATTYHVPDPYPTIQSGIDAASTGDTVLVACGTYYEHDILMKSGIILMSETAGADCVTIDAQRDWQEQGRVLYCENISESTLIKGFTLTGGYLEGAGGGGIYCGDHPSPAIESCIISDNSVAGNGAGFYCELYSSPTITSCTIRSNSAAFGGGGMYCRDSSSPILTVVTFESNGAGILDSGYPGGLYCVEGSSPRLTDCAFIGNSGDRGSGMHCDSGSPVLEHVVFRDNWNIGTGAIGGTMVCMGGTAALIDVIFSDNSGGEVYGVLDLGGCTSATLTRVTFAGTWGPGVRCSGCSPTVTNCTFYGDGLTCSDGASPTLARTIFAFGGGLACSDPSSQPVLECCDIFGNHGGDWVGCIEDQFGVNGNFSADPLFCGIADGSLPMIHADASPWTLHANSPCLPGNHPGGHDCGLIGAHAHGCGTLRTRPPTRVLRTDERALVETTTWGRIKAQYRR